MNIVAYYESYFEDLATRLNDIGHTPEKKRFWRSSNNDSLSEVTNAIQTELRRPCLVLDMLEFQFPTGTDNTRERVRGAFSILADYESGSASSIKQAWETARLIATKIRNYILIDARPSAQAMTNADSLFNKGIVFYEDISGDYTVAVNDMCAGFFFEFFWEIPADVNFGLIDFG